MELPQNQVVRAVTKRAVLIVMGVLIAALIIADIDLARDDIDDNTWSELVRLAGDRTIGVPWLFGLVMGHWFHPSDDLKPIVDPPGNALVVLLSTAVITALGLLMSLPMWLAFIAAAPVGAYLWPMSANPDALSELKETRK